MIRPEVIEASFVGSRTFLNLRLWNVVLAGVFAVQAVLLWVFSTGKTLPVNLNYLTTDPLQTAAQGKTVLTPAAHQWFTLNIVYLVVLGLFVVAITHLLLSTYYRAQYEKGLKRGVQQLRWLAYAVTEGLLLVTVGLLVGAQDIAVLVSLVALSTVKNLCLWSVERVDIGMPARQKLGLSISGLAALTQYVIIAFYLFGGSVYGTGTPGYLYGLFVTGLVGWWLVQMNILLHHRRAGRWLDYEYTERTYLLVELLVVSVLAWQIFAGALIS